MCDMDFTRSRCRADAFPVPFAGLDDFSVMNWKTAAHPPGCNLL